MKTAYKGNPGQEGIAAAKKDAMNEILKLSKKELNEAAIEGTIQDNQNPIFLLSSIYPALLSAIAKGQIDMVDLAKHELACRGYSNEGEWIGFDKAEINTDMHFDKATEKWMYTPTK